MILADWIVLVMLIIFAILGMLFGFGKGLKFFTGGIFGIIISIFVCYALGGLIYHISFVQSVLESFRNVLVNNGSGFCRFLLNIQIDIVVYYVALFILVTIIRIIIVKIVKSIVEIDNMFVIILNKTFGVVLFVGMLFFVMLMAFWIIALVKGTTIADYPSLEGSKLKLDWLYENNPFTTIIRVIKIRKEIIVT